MATININGSYYAFICTAANATSGATYTNNGFTYTVKKTLTAGTKLYTTGTGVPLSSGTLTLASGTGDATITFSSYLLDAHINGITYVNGDDLVISAEQRLVIDETPTNRPLNISANQSTTGTILIKNTSTTTPIIYSPNAETGNISITNQNNNLYVEGDWIQIATGTGATGQTIDFNTAVGGVAIDYPPCVWVETGDTRHKQLTVSGVSGYYMPFFNVGETADTAAVNILTTAYGDLDHGPIFQYDRTTKVATFGNGGAIASTNGGAVIPNGAKVVYPNIHFTSNVYNATYSSRNEIVVSTGGNADISVCAFSRNWGIGASSGFFNAGDVTMTSVSCVSRFVIGTIAGAVNLTNIAVTIDPSVAISSGSANLAIQGIMGSLNVDYLWCFSKSTATYAPHVYIASTTKLENVGSVFSWASNTTAGSYPFNLDTIYNANRVPVQVGPVYVVGGQLYLLRVNNIHIRELHHSDQMSRVAQTTISTNGCASNYGVNVTIAKTRNLSSNAPAVRNVLFTTDQTAYQYTIKDVVYDMKSNTSTGGSFYGGRIWASNFTLDNPRSALLSSGVTDTEKSRVSNIRSNTSLALGTNTFMQEGLVGTTASMAGAIPFDVEPAQFVWDTTARTSGFVRLMPPSTNKNLSKLEVVSGTQGTDWYVNGTNLVFPASGVELIYTNDFPIRGITNFTGAVWTLVGTLTTVNAGIDFSMKSAHSPSASWSSWSDATTAANWQTTLSGLSGYSSTTGFFLRYRIKSTGATAGRIYNYARISCNTDSSWTPAEIGFVPLITSGYVADTTSKLYDNTVPASPVDVWAWSLTGDSTTLDFPYDFDALPKDFKLKYRKSGYGEVIIEGDTYQRGEQVPISQTQYIVVNDATAQLITGITVDGATNTVTVDSNTSIDDLYAYTQWWSTQFDNMNYEIPFVTTDGINYTSTYNLTLNGGSITGTGNINIGAGTFSRAGSETSTLPITYNSGANVFGNVTVSGLVANSRVRLNNETDNIELYNAVVAGTSVSIPVTWTANKSLDLRVTYVNGTSAYLPYQAAGTLTSSMASFTVSQVVDTVYNTNAIDGSTVTEFIADYPNLEVDIDDGDGVTSVQRMYAWYQASTHSSQGIVYYFKGIVAQDSVNYQIKTGIVDLLLENTNASSIPVKITGAYLFRDDGTTVILSTSKSIQIDPSKAYVANSDNIERNMLTVAKFIALK